MQLSTIKELQTQHTTAQAQIASLKLAQTNTQQALEQLRAQLAKAKIQTNH